MDYQENGSNDFCETHLNLLFLSLFRGNGKHVFTGYSEILKLIIGVKESLFLKEGEAGRYLDSTYIYYFNAYWLSVV